MFQNLLQSIEIIIGVNAVTYGCLLDACVKCGRVNMAREIFREMESQGVPGNTVLYTTLLKGYAKTQDLQAAMEV